MVCNKIVNNFKVNNRTDTANCTGNFVCTFGSFPKIYILMVKIGPKKLDVIENWETSSGGNKNIIQIDRFGLGNFHNRLSIWPSRNFYWVVKILFFTSNNWQIKIILKTSVVLNNCGRKVSGCSYKGIINLNITKSNIYFGTTGRTKSECTKVIC